MTGYPQEVDQLRDRVRLFLQVILVIDLGSEILGFIIPLFVGGIPEPDYHPIFLSIFRWSNTVVLAGGWAWAKFARPGRIALIALDSFVTIGLAIFYGYTTSLLPGSGPIFGLLATVLAMVVRAALVPSSVLRTVAVGAICVSSVCLFAAGAYTDHEEPVAFWMFIIGSGFVVATSVMSHVTYGLRRQVREAMRLGQYELGRKLGEGGMGVVYEATHVMLRRPTAVKLLPTDKAGEETVARFEREVQQTSRLEHPNSVYIYDYGRTPDGLFYYAMEYLDGLTLEELVKSDGPLPAPRAIHLLQQAASALAEAHDMGLVHRDIKPANIMVCERANVPDTVKVLDFGLVKSIGNSEAKSEITQANTIVGTPHYLAPEAITDPDDVGPAADVYALGAVGFFLVTGREVFTGRTTVEICSKHLESQPPSPSVVLGREVDSALEQLILRCLAKNPQDRPAGGAELAEQLDEIAGAGWSLAEARQCWCNRERREIHAVDPTPWERTQLAVDVQHRK